MDSTLPESAAESTVESAVKSTVESARLLEKSETDLSDFHSKADPPCSLVDLSPLGVRQTCEIESTRIELGQSTRLSWSRIGPTWSPFKSAADLVGLPCSHPGRAVERGRNCDNRRRPQDVE